MDIVELHRAASERFGSLVRAVRPEQWSDPTPCAEWTVRDLVGHLVYENLWTVPLLSGATLEEVGDRFEGDVLGGDPVGAYTDAASAAIAAVAADGALDGTVHLSYGPESALEYTWQLFTDHLVHGWDLARAIGADETIPAPLVRACSLWFASHEDLYRSAGAVGPRIPLPREDADEQARLLAAFGRDSSRVFAS